MILTQPLHIVGVGSPQGDDSAAWEVIARLEQRLGDRDDVALHTLDSGQRLLDLLEDEGTWIIVDALCPRSEPGTIRRLIWPNDELECALSYSSHGINLAEALKLAQALGSLPKDLVIYGIEAESTGPSAPLSDAVERAVAELVDTIVDRYHLEE